MKVYTDKPSFLNVNITIETREELNVLKAALERAAKETEATAIPGPFGISLPVPAQTYNFLYKKMLDKLTYY